MNILGLNMNPVFNFLYRSLTAFVVNLPVVKLITLHIGEIVLIAIGDIFKITFNDLTLSSNIFK